MGDKGKLLAIGILFISALYLFVVPANILIPAQQMNVVDTYPHDGNWSNNGTLSGSMIDDSGTLTLSEAGSGTFVSDEFYTSANSTLELDNVIVSTDIQDTNDEAEIRVFGINSDGVVQKSKSITLQDGLIAYDLEGEYDGYYFQINLESTDNQEPSVGSVKLEYDELKPLTNNSLANDLLAWLLVLAGIGLIFS